METKPYIVQQGDFLLKIATRYGFDADAVWNYPQNKDIREARPNPNILCPGDVLYIPEQKRTFLPVRTGEQNNYTATLKTVSVPLTFSSEDKPLAGVECVVHGMPLPNRLTTDANGTIIVKVPFTLEEVAVEFPSLKFVRKIRIGHLDPVSKPSGVLQRLRNLGHLPAHMAADGVNEDDLKIALCAFQQAGGLKVTGELDEATRNAMTSAHGS